MYRGETGRCEMQEKQINNLLVFIFALLITTLEIPLFFGGMLLAGLPNEER